MTTQNIVELDYFSDILCIWAYLAKPKLDEIARDFGHVCCVTPRYITLFGDTKTKIVDGWHDRGGAKAYGAHVRQVAEQFSLTIHHDVWSNTIPASSMGIHMLLCAVRILCEQGQTIPGAEMKIATALRDAFFDQGQDISDPQVQQPILQSFEVDYDAAWKLVRRGDALAVYDRDIKAAERFRVEGSPTYLLNDGRQKLYGNVGYRIIEANIRELMERPDSSQASWC